MNTSELGLADEMVPDTCHAEFQALAKLSIKPSSGCSESGHSVQSSRVIFTQGTDLKQ